MRKDFPADAPPEALLLALEEAVRADPALSAEWAEARAAWPRSAGDPRSEDRFREWFLLERVSRALGAPPAAAWAPAEQGDRDLDPWTRLLEAQFRILQVADEEDGTARLRDLWSGMQFAAVPLPAAARDAVLLLGRVAPRGEEGGCLLPGWRALEDAALATSLADDLLRARLDQPGARLSQRECELLLAPRLRRASAREPVAAENRLQRLADCLAGAEGWTTERAVALLESSGADALLEALAFDSEVPLEPLRRLLAEWTAEASAADAAACPPAAGAEELLDPAAVESALAAYDGARAQGGSLNRAWSELRAALALGEGADAEREAWAEDGAPEPIGPDELPGLGFWMEAWHWERSAAGKPPSAAEAATAAAFAAFVEELREARLDAAEIRDEDVWRFLAASRDEPELARRERDLAAVVHWLHEEQAAFESGNPESWSAQDRERLRASVALNASLRARRVAHPVLARVSEVEPPRVADEQGELTEVAGLPKEGTPPPLRRGDLLFGAWVAGVFEASAWFPQLRASAQEAAR